MNIDLINRKEVDTVNLIFISCFNAYTLTYRDFRFIIGDIK